MFAPADVQATFCTALVRRWTQLGLRHAVVAPGSRSTPMALALAESGVRVEIVHDERSAAFVALGVGLASGLPAVVLCTSGTAATHLHAALVEAGLSNVPLIALTADRPPELHDVGAAQTIDQTKLFGDAPRWFHDPGVADVAASPTWAAMADQAWSAAAGGTDPGPVHLNLPMREPLVGRAIEGLGTRVPAVAGGARLRLPVDVDSIASTLSGRRGVIVAGRGVGDDAAVDALATTLGWPVLAEPRSGCRHLAAAVGAFDSIGRVGPFVDAHRPEVVLRLGEPPASKVLGQWLAATSAVQLQVDGSTRRFDPDHVVHRHIAAPVDELCRGLAERCSPAPGGWLTDWTDAERLAQAAIDAAIGDALTEPGVARVLTSGALRGHLVVASSMPVRDVEWYGGSAAGLTVHANRGANGIDGVVSTAIGVALATGAPTTVLLGDVALCHDAGALTALASRPVDLRIVVIDNDGGGIFSFLGQHDQLDTERFEQLFGTPHGTDLVALAAAHRIPATTVETSAELVDAVQKPGTRLVRVPSNREANLAIHRQINAAVAQALT